MLIAPLTVSSAWAAEAGTPFADVISFKTKPKVSVTTLIEAMKRAEVYLAKEPGMISRQLLVDGNGAGLWIIVWRSEADRDRSENREPVGEEAAAYDALYDLLIEKSISEKSYNAPLAVLADSAK